MGQSVALDKELQCLAANVYFEARNESFNGKVAVALVTLNRQDSGKYPKSICSVVYQKNQFSWTKKFSKINVDKKQWNESKLAALTAIMNRDYLGKFNATHFHSIAVLPRWANKGKIVCAIGGHIFYSL